ncbi:P80 family lipoprotein, partial [Mycoplasmopsis bovis]|uniref:P80 family lipoprotein n=1 Tax=Mycoplasmopsis bovis TaxID=28903 RepID=UPI003D271CF6
EKERRSDVILLINGMPLIHIELKNSGKTTVNYKKIKDKNNKSVKALSEIYNKFKDSLIAKSLTLLAGGEYTSSYQTKPEYAFGIGSTAGYRHNYIPDKAKKVVFTLK